MIQDLRPMRAGELLDRTFTTLWNHFLLFTGIAAIPLAIGLLLRFVSGPMTITTHSVMQGTMVLRNSLYSLFYALVILPAVTGATAWAVANLAMGGSPSIHDAWKQTVRRILSLMGSTLLAYMAIGGAGALLFSPFMALMLVPGGNRSLAAGGFLIAGIVGLAAIAFVLWVSMGMALAQPAVVLEGAGPLTSLKRSWTLAKGGRWHILLVYVLYIIITMVVKGVLDFPFLYLISASLRHGSVPAWLTMTSNSVTTVTSALVLPLLAIGLSLEYINQRIQKEAFDLDVMLRSLQTPMPSSSPELGPLAGAEPPAGD